MWVERVGRGIILRSLVGFAVAVLAGASGCGGGGAPESETEQVVLSANVLGTPIATVVVEVTAADIPQPLVFNLTVRNGVATGTIRLPPGLARTITVRGFDTLGQITHEGSKTIDVDRGSNPPVSIPMVARAGDVPIVVQVGPVAIVVAPGSASMSPGGTLQLTATISAPGGEVSSGAVEWATSNPAVATVDEHGLVTAVSVGPVTIVATYAGVAGTSALTVGAAWTGVRQLGSAADDFVAGLALHAGSALYVVGRTGGSLDGNTSFGGWDAFLVKYDLSGARLWTRQLGSPGDDQATGVAVDAAGEVYVTGMIGAGIAGSMDAFLVKYDSAGNSLWTRFMATPAEDRAGGVLVDASGTVSVAGSTGGSLDGNVHLGEEDVFVARFDAAGDALGTLQLGTAQNDTVAHAAIDGAGTIHILEYIGSYGEEVLTVDASGTYHAFDVYFPHQILTAIAADADGSRFLAGDVFFGNSANGVLWKYDPLDASLWTRDFGVYVAGANEWTWDVALGSGGDAFVTGSTGAGLDGNVSAGGDDLFLVKYDSAGNKLWTRQLGTAAQDEGRCLVVDGAGDAYVAGHTAGEVDGSASAGGLDVFVAKYDRLGVKQ